MLLLVNAIHLILSKAHVYIGARFTHFMLDHVKPNLTLRSLYLSVRANHYKSICLLVFVFMVALIIGVWANFLTFC